MLSRLPFCAINVIQAFAYEWAAKGSWFSSQIYTAGILFIIISHKNH
jgi:hypothetical protein